MLIQKLRLQRGWSQQQLAEMSGLSTRTVQRLEAGKPASMESLKSLAAVFEVDFAHLQETTTMTSHITPTSEPLAASSSAADFATALRPEEKDALQYVRELKRLYYSAILYVLVVCVLAVVNWLTNPAYLWVGWVALGWGAGLCLRAVKVFDPLLGPHWERRQVEKRLGRRL